jgi:hypothetical protein
VLRDPHHGLVVHGGASPRQFDGAWNQSRGTSGPMQPIALERPRCGNFALLASLLVIDLLGVRRSAGTWPLPNNRRGFHFFGTSPRLTAMSGATRMHLCTARIPRAQRVRQARTFAERARCELEKV